MKKSELKTLIREIIEEMSYKARFTYDSINKLKAAGFLEQPDESFSKFKRIDRYTTNSVSVDTTKIPDTFSVSWGSENSDGGNVGVIGIESAIEKASEQL